jgi:hypothetical protein
MRERERKGDDGAAEESAEDDSCETRTPLVSIQPVVYMCR